MKAFLNLCVLLLLVSKASLAADSPKDWFKTYGWDVSSCDVESTTPPKNNNPFFKTTLYNSSDIDNVRPGIWSQKNEGIRIFSSMEAGESKSWAAIRDFTTVYVLDSANRRCIAMFRTTFADEGNEIDIMRGMDGKTTKRDSASAPKKKTYKTSSKSSSRKSGCQWGDCENGVGESLQKNGVRYVGEFVAGKWQGYGIFIDKDGDVCEGQYRKAHLMDLSSVSIKAGLSFLEETHAVFEVVLVSLLNLTGRLTEWGTTSEED